MIAKKHIQEQGNPELRQNVLNTIARLEKDNIEAYKLITQLLGEGFFDNQQTKSNISKTANYLLHTIHGGKQK